MNYKEIITSLFLTEIESHGSLRFGWIREKPCQFKAIPLYLPLQNADPTMKSSRNKEI